MTTNSHKLDTNSILDGINVAAPKKAAPHAWSKIHATNVSMSSIEWTPKRKKIAAVAFCLFSLCGLGLGAWLMIRMQPPGLPQTAEEALAVMKSAKFDQLDSLQKEEYENEANKLMANMPWEERRELFQNDRETMEKLMERNMEEMAKKFARGEQPQFPFGGPRGDRPQGERPQGDRPDRGTRPDGGGGAGGGGPGGGGPGGGGGGRGGDPNARRDNAERKMAERVSKGNPQSNGLMGQMRQAMQQARQSSGPR